MKPLLLSALFAAAAFGQATFSITIPGESAVSVTLSAQAVPSITSFISSSPAPASATTLASSALAADSTFTLASAADVTTGMGIVTGSEVSLVTGVNGAVVTVTRARLGTTAAAHASGIAATFLRSGSYGEFIANLISDAVRANMVTFPGSAVSAAMAAQQATISTAIAASVSHVP